MGKFETKLTPEIAKSICDHLRQGQYKRDAAALVGIHRDTLDHWERRGRNARELAAHPPLRPDFTSDAEYRKARTAWAAKMRAEKIYAEFSIDAELSLDFGAGWLVQQILAHAADPNVKNNKWTAYMTILERSRRSQWGRGQRVEHTGPQGGTFEVKLAFDPKVLDPLIDAQIEKHLPDPDARS